MATTETLKNERMETLFLLTLLATLVQAGFILWDLVTLFPAVEKLLGLAKPNTIYASALMSNLYLALLGAYAGYKEFQRWTDSAQPQDLPDAQTTRFKRGELIVSSWIILAIFAIALWQLQLISRLPNELFRTAFQSFGILFGTYASKGLFSKAKSKDTKIAQDSTQKVIDYVKSNGSIDTETCQKFCLISRFRAYRLLKRLESEGTLKKEGAGKRARYVLATAQ
ncbi:MAG: hypothetical protein KKH91_04350 [Elusimicrobia bacterium]|nr:hypothetical protein [Elusimicrobiota bacterium]